MKKKAAFVIWIVCAFLLAGCWDRREINDIAFVVGTGIDKEKGKYVTTVQIALPGQMGGAGSQGGGGGTSGKKEWYNLAMSGITARDSNTREQKRISRNLYFAHRRTFLIGENLAREGIESMLDVLGRFPQNRLTANVLVTEGPASRVLNTEVEIEKFPSEMIRELATNFMKTPRTLKQMLTTMLAEGIDLTLPTAASEKQSSGKGGKTKTGLKVDGLAIFHKNKLAGIVHGDRMLAIMIAMNDARRPEYVIPAPNGGGELSVQFQQIRSTLRPDVINGDHVTMNLEIRAKGSIVEDESNYRLTDDDNMEKIEQMVDQKITADLAKAIQYLQTKLHADPLGFGKSIYAYRPKEWYRLRNHWENVYPQMQVKIVVDTHLEHTGTVLNPLGRKDK